MKRTLIVLIAILFFAGIQVSQAQKLKLKEGSLSFLKGQKEINIQFDYSNMSVGKFENEEDYITKKKADYNADEPGRGDRWAKDWVDDRVNVYEPQFQELMNKYLTEIGLKVVHNDQAKYTMIFHTTFTEPGFNVGVWRGDAYIDAEIRIVETANPGKVLALITMEDSRGRTFGGNDYDTGTRISESYAKGGKELAKFMMKHMK
ncbi:MAG: hypothetical protein KKA81_13765 [Bacteroidetes bacterium]|nr:hypothetical protein [Bacteroidota bacterium]